jgi:hypothetical protein
MGLSENGVYPPNGAFNRETNGSAMDSWMVHIWMILGWYSGIIWYNKQHMGISLEYHNQLNQYHWGL